MFFCKNFAAIVSIPYFNAVRVFINNLFKESGGRILGFIRQDSGI